MAEGDEVGIDCIVVLVVGIHLEVSRAGGAFVGIHGARNEVGVIVFSHQSFDNPIRLGHHRGSRSIIESDVAILPRFSNLQIGEGNTSGAFQFVGSKFNCVRIDGDNGANRGAIVGIGCRSFQNFIDYC